MTRAAVETAVAGKVSAAEAIHARALGHDTMDIAVMSFGAFCEVYTIANMPRLPYVWQEPKVIVGTGKFAK